MPDAPVLDHLVYAVPDLRSAMADLEKALGVRPVVGGRHEGLGTWNALLSFGDTTYLELIASDPDGPVPSTPRPFGIDELDGPRLVTWAARTQSIDEVVSTARAAGFDPGSVIGMSRARPDGVSVRWRLSIRPKLAGGGLVPFLIDWCDSPHPSNDAPGGCRLASLYGEHPQVDDVKRDLAALGVTLDVRASETSRLIAWIEGPKGRLELR